MKPNELRIGNWIKGLFNTNEGLIEKHFQASVLVIQEIEEWEGHDYQPIPLNEEWLLKFGFEKGAYDIYWIMNDDIDLNIVEGSKGWVVSESNFNPPIKYVHQLQNLYFALTGQEL